MTVLYTPSPRPPTRPPGPKTTAERAQALLDVAAKLNELIAEEDSALQEQRLRHLGQTASRKQKLTYAFDELCRLLRVDPTGLANLDEGTKHRLKIAVETLRISSHDHAIRLRTKSGAHRTLVESLVRTVNQLRQADHHYASGLGLAAPARGGEAPSAAFNVRI